VFGLVGIFLIRAAIDYKPEQGGGPPNGALGEDSESVVRAPSLLGIVAARA